MLQLERTVPLAPYTTLQVGGSAAAFVRLRDVSELPELPALIAESGFSPFVLGGGSNVLIADGTLNRLVIKNELRGVTYEERNDDEVLVRAAAGEDWDELVAEVVAHELAGLENLSGIPGTVGAAPIQNINAYGAAVADTIEAVEAFDLTTGKFRTFSADECQFAYRDSIFKQSAGKDCMVVSVTFALKRGGAPQLTYQSSSQSIARYLAQSVPAGEPTLADVREAVLSVRRNIGMLAGIFNSAGSFFKNTIVSAEQFASILDIVTTRFPAKHAELSPWYWTLPDGRVKLSTAFLMECTPYNKRTYATHQGAGAALSPLHTLSIINRGDATAAEVQALATTIREEVTKTFGVTIEPEVTFVT